MTTLPHETPRAEAEGLRTYRPQLTDQTEGPLMSSSAYLRVSREVSLENRLVDPRDRDWERGVVSCDRLGEAGGPL